MDGLDQRASALRRFNRFYTRRLGLLEDHLVGSPYSLTEARVLFELAHRDGLTATVLSHALELDAGYLSRVLGRFARQKLIGRKPSLADGRASELHLTARGRQAAAALDAASQAQSRALLAPLALHQQRRLLQAMQDIEGLLEPAAAPIVLREPAPGDYGWVISRHGALYAQEYGWNSDFEALVAEIIAEIIRRPRDSGERAWIAEQGGQIVGAVFLVRETAELAKLRLLYVEPSARGQGLGGLLVDECMRYAKRAGYARMVLWTNSNLVAARAIYQSRGFHKTAEEAHHSFGHDLIGETWEAALDEAVLPS